MTDVINLRTIGLTELLGAESREGEVAEYLSTFTCEKNREVQRYLHCKAINSEQRSFSKTTLVVDYNHAIVGYFTLLIKGFHFENASGGVKKALTGNKKADSFVTILIAQMGRSDLHKGKVSGDTILDLALEKSEAIRDLSALRVVCVEHDDHQSLNSFYEKNDFKLIQTNHNEKVMRFVKLPLH